jgi:hypothetical protein
MRTAYARTRSPSLSSPGAREAVSSGIEARLSCSAPGTHVIAAESAIKNTVIHPNQKAIATAKAW